MRLKLFFATILTSLGLVLPVAPAIAAFNPLGSACQGAGASSPACQQNAKQNGSSTNPVANTIHTAANLIAIIAGIAAVIMVLVGGFTFVTSSGNPERAKSGRATLTGAIVGLVIIALAWTIVTFVTDKLVKT
ncbi:MAG TPA: hypothetical protein VHD84_00975 [Candidatus Saccharimonadales bacterium]|nr:hypothetical protein [Candidatus Saccharimonadales bacterium]